MGKICVERATGHMLAWVRYGTPHIYDAAVHDLLTQDDPPPPDTRWDGTTWVPLTVTDQERLDRALAADKAFRTLVLWCAQHFGLSPAQAKAELLTIFRTL